MEQISHHQQKLCVAIKGTNNQGVVPARNTHYGSKRKHSKWTTTNYIYYNIARVWSSIRNMHTKANTICYYIEV